MLNNFFQKRFARSNSRPIKCQSHCFGKMVISLCHLFVVNCAALLIQKHFNGSSYFNRSWAEYKVGFGDPSGDDYWIGNDRLSQLTLTGRYKLRFDLQSRSNPNNWYWAEYSTFQVQSEANRYRLQVAGYSGNAGGFDAFGYSNGRMFTTYDRDNDGRN